MKTSASFAFVIQSLRPVSRNSFPDGIARVVNEAIAVAAQPYRVQVELPDMAGLFTPGFEYRDSMEVDGEDKIVRESDGVHLNGEGAELAADAVLDALEQDFGD